MMNDTEFIQRIGTVFTGADAVIALALFRELTAERDKYRDACERLIGHYGDRGNWVGVAFQGREMEAKDLFVPCNFGFDFARQVKAELEGMEGSEIVDE